MKSSIQSEKILVGSIFSDMWFNIPEYQRPYVWESDQITELLDDTSYAMIEKPNSDYFLGSFVFQPHKRVGSNGIEFIENDLLDGQQRITTLLLLFAVLRDRVSDKDAMQGCQECIFQSANTYKRIPERVRIVFEIRNNAQQFLENISKAEGFTKSKSLDDFVKSDDISVKNMAIAVRDMHAFFDTHSDIRPESFFDYILNNVLLIFVSTENLEDAFRLFTILNNRGMPLRNSDILKSINLGEVSSLEDKKKYALLWETAESDLGDDFDRFLSHLRTILVKDKARLSLLQEFEDKIYDPKETEKATGHKKAPLLKKGKETFELIKLHLSNYQKITSGNNYDHFGNFYFDNLIKTMFVGLPSTDWIPPLLRYYERFGHQDIYKFLVKLDNKFSADWINQLTPTSRIDSMNQVIKVIDSADVYSNVLESSVLLFDKKKLFSELDGDIYGKRYARYVLLKLDFLYNDNSHKMNHESISVEHILPQNPKKGSKWESDFSQGERENLTDKLGNLVLISRKKNSSQGCLDYKDKREKYFKNNINTCPNSLRVLNNYDVWSPEAILLNQQVCMEMLKSHYTK